MFGYSVEPVHLWTEPTHPADCSPKHKSQAGLNK